MPKGCRPLEQRHLHGQPDLAPRRDIMDTVWSQRSDSCAVWPKCRRACFATRSRPRPPHGTKRPIGKRGLQMRGYGGSLVAVDLDVSVGVVTVLPDRGGFESHYAIIGTLRNYVNAESYVVEDFRLKNV